MPDILNRLACRQGRNDETPNVELAEYLCQSEDAAGIRAIVEGFKGRDKTVASDCIKVLYEIGARRPDLIAGYAGDFIASVNNKNNRLAWGSMTALAAIRDITAEQIYKKLPVIVSAYENGSVITADNCVTVFAKLCKYSVEYEQTVLPILLNHLQTCRPKEVARHAERASVCFKTENAETFIEVLERRRSDLTPPQQTRVAKLLKTLCRL